MSPTVLLIIYCLAIPLGSLAGGWIPLVVRLTHTRLQLAMSFVSGAMLGVGLLHLLPHAYFEFGAIYPPVWWLTAGFLFMFFVERVFHFHHHDAPADLAASATAHSHAHEHHGHSHEHHGHSHHAHGHDHGERRLSWKAALIGLSLHSMLDGIALAASVATESQEAGHGQWAGLAVFLVVFLHKPFDSMTLGTLMAVDGRSAAQRHLVNGLYALAIPLGVVLFYLGVDASGADQQQLVGAALAFAAGTFLCIATSDLLPELQFHAHDRFKLSASLLLGLALAAGIVLLEERHHQHGAPVHAEHEHEHGE
ncbi:MAG TPA: ZIP family metal transporter [Pirellulales bacterium]|nr:ZIP family metal transporter [Pirellulales bacterium]